MVFANFLIFFSIISLIILFVLIGVLFEKNKGKTVKRILPIPVLIVAGLIFITSSSPKIVNTKMDSIKIDSFKIEYTHEEHQSPEGTVTLVGEEYEATIDKDLVSVDPDYDSDDQLYLIEYKNLRDDDRWWAFGPHSTKTTYVITNNPEGR